MGLPYITLHEPQTLKEACDLLRRYGSAARVMAGGTDLVVDLRRGRITGVDHLVSLKNLSELRSIELHGESLSLGALVTPNQALCNSLVLERFPSLVDAIRVMAAEPIRNMATIGGNLAGAVPCSDFAPLLIAAGSSIELSSGAKKRVLPVEAFITGPRETAIGDDEVVVRVLVPEQGPLTGLSYEKFMLREANGVAVAGACAMVGLGSAGKIERAKIVLTAVSPLPAVAEEAQACLIGHPPGEEHFTEAAKLARRAAKPITDVRGSAEYRLELVEVLTRRALAKAAARALE